jgi:transcriptional regulator
VRENPYYELTDEAVIRRLIRENPWAVLVSKSSSGLVASHYPILLEEDREELSIVTHLGRPDEQVHELGENELLVIVQGPHGYISSSWYGAHIEVPTWNFIVAHLSGVPEILDPAENFEVLTRLVDHFEQHVADPRPLDATPEVADDARRDSRGTVGLRLMPTQIVAKRKMSQNKSPEIVETVLGELEGNGSYANESLAREMRLVRDTDTRRG